MMLNNLDSMSEEKLKELVEYYESIRDFANADIVRKKLNEKRNYRMLIEKQNYDMLDKLNNRDDDYYGLGR